jgi:hypothetical protein
VKTIAKDGEDEAIESVKNKSKREMGEREFLEKEANSRIGLRNHGREM